MRIIKSLGLILAVLFVFTGCSGSSSAIVLQKQTEFKKIEKPVISDNKDKIYWASNTAGIQLLQKISAENGRKNAVFSPVSLSTILAVLENGAAGKTREEIDAIINPEHISTEELNEKYCNTINHLINAGYKENGNKTTLIELANSLWVQEKLRIKDSFLRSSNIYFGAEAYNVDFAKDGTVSDINRWIEDKTHGRMQNYMTEVNPQTSIIALNTLYFNGKWQSPFDKAKTQKEDFYLNSGNIVKVDMMNAEKRIGYYEDDQIQAGRFDYYGCNMLVILPKGNIDEYVRNLDYEDIQKAYGRLENTKVKVKFPKFSFKQKNKLVDHLKAMGMESVFDVRNADFTGIANRSEGFNLFVSDISQECFISADEEGTEAAALTSVVLAGCAKPKENVPPEFYLNKPFMFVINDNRTGLILFIGKVENPLDSEQSDASLENEDTEKTVEFLLNGIINKGPKTSSNPYDYIKSSDDFNKLAALGKPAMDAMLDIFSQSNEDGLKEYIMACACARIMGIFDEQKGIGTSSGREWFYKYGQFEKTKDFQIMDADFDIFPKDPVNRKNVLLPEDTDKKNLDEVISNYILAKNRSAYRIGEKSIEAHEIYRTEEKEGILNVYLLVRFGWFGFENNIFTMVSGGGGVPVRMQLKKSEDGTYEVLEYRRAMDGGMYEESIREMFPEDLAELVIEGDDETKKKLEDIQKMKAENYLTEIQRQDRAVSFCIEKEKPEADARKAIYLVTLMRREFPDWNGIREILVRTGGKAPGMKVRCVLKTQCEKEKDGQYTVILTKNWEIKINGIQPVSYWKYRVIGERVELVEEQDNDNRIRIIK